MTSFWYFFYYIVLKRTMINFKQVSEYCCEDISLIENYEQAVSDENEVWQCHHRNEIVGDKRFSRFELMKMNMYYERPASEFIFLTELEHKRLHNTGRKYTDEQKQRMSDAKKGRRYSLESRRRMSETKKGLYSGEKAYWFGKKRDEETKQKISKSLKGEKSPKSKSVYMIEDGTVVKEFINTLFAAEYIGIDRSAIVKCCNGRLNTAGGYKWKYASDCRQRKSVEDIKPLF